MQADDECSHLWITNSGQGGAPEFRPNRQMSPAPTMHVMCRRLHQPHLVQRGAMVEPPRGTKSERPR
jgi:hypothetical protein